MGAYERVIVGLDLDEATAPLLLARARLLAEPGAIEVVHVSDRLHKQVSYYSGNESFATSEQLDEAVVAEVSGQLDKLCNPHGITRHVVLGGRPPEVIHRHADGRADVVVVGSHGRHGWQLLFGSTSNAVLHGTPCDVLAVHLPEDGKRAPVQYRNVLVAVNLGEESKRVLAHGASIADAAGATLKLCHVIEDPAHEPSAYKALQTLGARYKLGDEALFLCSGRAPNAIHKLADDLQADLVVVGTHGRHGLELVKGGSTANAVLHGAGCDALAVRVH